MAPKEQARLDDPEEAQSMYSQEADEQGHATSMEPRMFGKGIVDDIRRTIGTHWVSEMTNFNMKTVSVTCLVFISVIAPTLTFGAVYGKTTDGHIGATETILATAWVGVVYSLIGGMPMCIIGSTGPVLAFSKAMYNLSESLDVPFLAFNAWVSIWLLAYCLLAGFFDLTRFVRLATRFTDEIFALIIVSIFVMDAVGDPFSPVGILRYFDPNHASHNRHGSDDSYNYMEVALLSTVLGFGTTALIFFFRSFKNSAFFCNDSVRTSIHGFAVSMAVVIGAVVNGALFKGIKTEELSVPDSFQPTFQCCDDSCATWFPGDCPTLTEAVRSRDWFVNLWDLNGKGWVPVMAGGPALLAFLLCFLDNGLTWHLINHSTDKLKHGDAFNYDLCLSGIFNCVNGLFGLPWLVATTVPCMIHLDALSEKDKDGKYVSVQETRLTMLFSHLLLGFCLLFLEVLKLLPMPVLYGVFLFMGLSSMLTLQLYYRIMMFFQQPSKYGSTPVTDHMTKKRMHMYTFIQLLIFGLIFTVQNVQATSMFFPLMTLLCIPSRLFIVPKMFEDWELLLLDGAEEAIQKWITAKNLSSRTAASGGSSDSSREDPLRIIERS